MVGSQHSAKSIPLSDISGWLFDAEEFVATKIRDKMVQNIKDKNKAKCALKGRRQLWDLAELDTTFDRLICVYLNTKSNVRVGYI